MLAVVVSLLTSTMSSSHSMPVLVVVVSCLSGGLVVHRRAAVAVVSPSTAVMAGRLVIGPTASSFIPHLGQRPGWSLVTSGCIGQA